MDKIYRPFYQNLMVKERSQFREISEFLVDGWEIETVIPAHGDIIRGKTFIQAVFRDFFKLKD